TTLSLHDALPISLRRPVEDVVGAPAGVGRLADPDAHAQEVAVVEVGLDRPQAVVAGQPPAGLHPQRADGEVELVVHDDEPFDVVDPEPAHELGHRLAGVVVVGLGPGQRETAPTHAHLAHDGQLLALLQPAAVTLGQERDGLGPDVVTAALVFAARV